MSEITELQAQIRSLEELIRAYEIVNHRGATVSGKQQINSCQNNCARAEGSRRPLLPEENELARRLYLDGMSWAAVGKKLNRSASHLWRNNMDISRTAEQASLNWSEKNQDRTRPPEVRARISESQQIAWSKVNDRGARGRKRGETLRLMRM